MLNLVCFTLGKLQTHTVQLPNRNSSRRYLIFMAVKCVMLYRVSILSGALQNVCQILVRSVGQRSVQLFVHSDKPEGNLYYYVKNSI